MSKRKRLFMIIVVMFMGSFFATAQSGEPSGKNNSTWVNLGLGAGSVQEVENSISASLSLTYQTGRHAFSLRTATSGGIFEDSFWDLALLYGWGTKPAQVHASAGIGISLVGGSRSEGLFSETEKVNTTIGLPLEIQLSWRPLRFLGLCAYGFANINKEESFVGLTFCIQIGKLR